MKPMATGAIIIGMVNRTRNTPAPGSGRQSNSASVKPQTSSPPTARTTTNTVNLSELQKSLSCRSWPQFASVADVSRRPLSVLTLLKLITTEKISGKTFRSRSRRIAGRTNGHPLHWASVPARLCRRAGRGAVAFATPEAVDELSVGETPIPKLFHQLHAAPREPTADARHLLGCAEVQRGPVGRELLRVALLIVDLVPFAGDPVESRLGTALSGDRLASPDLDRILEGCGPRHAQVLDRMRVEVALLHGCEVHVQVRLRVADLLPRRDVPEMRVPEGVDAGVRAGRQLQAERRARDERQELVRELDVVRLLWDRAAPAAEGEPRRPVDPGQVLPLLCLVVPDPLRAGEQGRADLAVDLGALLELADDRRVVPVDPEHSCAVLELLAHLVAVPVDHAGRPVLDGLRVILQPLHVAGVVDQRLEVRRVEEEPSLLARCADPRHAVGHVVPEGLTAVPVRLRDAVDAVLAVAEEASDIHEVFPGHRGRQRLPELLLECGAQALIGHDVAPPVHELVVAVDRHGDLVSCPLAVALIDDVAPLQRLVLLDHPREVDEIWEVVSQPARRVENHVVAAAAGHEVCKRLRVQVAEGSGDQLHVGACKVLERLLRGSDGARDRRPVLRNHRQGLACVELQRRAERLLWVEQGQAWPRSRRAQPQGRHPLEERIAFHAHGLTPPFSLMPAFRVL